MTFREEDILAFIETFQYEYGFSPSVREVTEGVGLSSVSGGKYWLDRMRQQGIVDWNPGIARSLRIVGPA